MIIDCDGATTREINQRIRSAVRAGEPEVTLVNPAARHNLGVGLVEPCRVRIEGSAGYYCAGLCDGVDLEIGGSAGWGVAENLMSGTITVHGNAGNGAAATLHGGLVVVRGEAGARAGISMKGGTLVVGGSVGYMSGFMMQKGTMVICGNAGEGLGDSMYDGRIFVGGEIAGLGNDAVLEELHLDDLDFLSSVLGTAGVQHPAAFKKVVSGKQLYNFDRRNFDSWKHAL